MQLQVSRLKQRVILLQALSQISPSQIPSSRLMVSLIITAGANKAAFLRDRQTDRWSQSGKSNQPLSYSENVGSYKK
jgi:hypothetical protein